MLALHCPAGVREYTMQNDTDRLVHWLLDSLELETTLFHLGQYCGTWRASTTGLARAGFHLVLNGNCWLHLPNEGRSVQLTPGDSVFFLRDILHYLTPTEDLRDTASIAPGSVEMAPIDCAVEGSVALACGFFGFRAGLTQALMTSFPDYVVIPANDKELQAIRPLFELVLAEAKISGDAPSPVIARLVDLMFFYVIRSLAARPDVVAGVWSVLARPEFSSLLQALINEPSRDWTVEAMAELSHMSRATFFKRFMRTSGVSPAHFLTLLRMKIASQMLAQGQSISRTAEQVGYQSEAAFSRAFKKVIGELPGAYKRARGEEAGALLARSAPPAGNGACGTGRALQAH
jgi:AraC-like DNA-binding protein